MQGLNRYRLFSMASEAKESPANNPGLHTTPDEATKSYFMQQTVIISFSFSIYSSCTCNYVCLCVLWIVVLLYFDCRCFELRIPKWALTSILASWACRKCFFLLSIISDSDICVLMWPCLLGLWLMYNLYFVSGNLHSFVILTWLCCKF